VGNALAGDTAADCDFLDTGNGAGVAAALAATAGTTADVGIKTGVYDFSLPGAPVLPLAVPAAVRLHGSGRTALAGGPVTGTTFLMTPIERALFTVGTVGRVSDFTVILPAAATPAVSGISVIDLVSGSPRAEHIQIDFEGGENNPDETLLQAFRLGPGASAFDCGTRADGGYSRLGGLLAAFQMESSTRILDCDGDNLDIGYRAVGSNYELVDCRAVNNRGNSFQLGGSDGIADACRANRDLTGTGFFVTGFRTNITGCEANGTGAGTHGIRCLPGSDGSVIANNTLINNTIVGLSVEGGSDEVIVGPNHFSGNARNEDFSASGPVLRRVIPAFSTSIIGPFVRAAETGETTLYDASAGIITIDAPLTPGVSNEGDFFEVKEITGAVHPFAVTISGNGATIEAPTGGGIAATQLLTGIPDIGVRWVLRGGVWRVIPT